MWYQPLTMLDVRRRCRWRRLTLRSWWSGTPPPGHWMQWFLSGTRMCWNTHTKQTNCWIICWTSWSVVCSFYRLLNVIISVGYTKVLKHTHTNKQLSDLLDWLHHCVLIWLVNLFPAEDYVLVVQFYLKTCTQTRLVERQQTDSKKTKLTKTSATKTCVVQKPTQAQLSQTHTHTHTHTHTYTHT